MTRYISLAAVMLLAAAATPASAWEAIQEPGAFAFYHPNGDLGLGSSPPSDAAASQTVHSDGLRMSVKPRHINRAPAIRRY
jgi:hypothetical protein